MDPRDVPPEHGSTVLPGVPLPPSALPRGPVQPEGATAPPGPPEPVVEPFPGADPRPAVPAVPVAAAGAAAASEAPAAAPAAPKVPWWKKEIGGRKQPAGAPPAATPTAPPVPGPAASPTAPMTAPMTAPITTAAPPPAAQAPPAPQPTRPQPAPEPTTPEPATQDQAAAVPAAAPGRAASRGRHAAPEPEPQGRRTLVLLIAVGAALVALTVALFVWPGLLVGSGDAEGAAFTEPTPVPVTLAVPDELAGLPRITGAPDAALQERLDASPVEGLSNPVGAVYGSDGTASLQIIAWRAVDPPAKDAVEAAFAGFEGSNGTPVPDVQQLPTGDLGGHMACGATTAQGGDAVQCFWADAQSFGSISVLGPKDRPAAHAAALQARAGVETR